MPDTDINIALPTLPEINLNQSRMKTYQSCDRLFGWNYVENIVPEERPLYFSIGTAVHEGLHYAHLHNGTPTAFAEGVQIAKNIIRESFPKGPKLNTDEAERLDAEALVEILIICYAAHYKKTLWKPLGIEVAFRVEVGQDTGVFLIGRLDKLVIYRERIWIVDYKTMSRLDPRDFRKYHNDLQLTAYLYGGTKALTEQAKREGKTEPVIIHGAIIDGLVKTKSPQYHREQFTRTPQQLEAFEREFVVKAWEMAAKRAVVDGNKNLYTHYTDRIYDAGRDHGWKALYPKNTQHCFTYGTCSMFDLCIKDNEVRRQGFQQREPDYVDEAANANTTSIQT